MNGYWIAAKLNSISSYFMSFTEQYTDFEIILTIKTTWSEIKRPVFGENIKSYDFMIMEINTRLFWLITH